MRLILFLLSMLSIAVPSHVELFRDDFSKFPPGWLSKPVGLLNGAIQEYHYLPQRGVPTHPWYNPITHNDSWVAGDEDGKTYPEQHLLHDQPERWQPLFVRGDERDESSCGMRTPFGFTRRIAHLQASVSTSQCATRFITTRTIAPRYRCQIGNNNCQTDIMGEPD
jgi:hypothetical protein